MMGIFDFLKQLKPLAGLALRLENFAKCQKGEGDKFPGTDAR